jgi:hypothetical protein
VRTFEDMRLETKCGESPILIGEGIDRSRLHGLREPQGLGIILGAVR